MGIQIPGESGPAGGITLTYQEFLDAIHGLPPRHPGGLGTWPRSASAEPRGGNGMGRLHGPGQLRRAILCVVMTGHFASYRGGSRHSQIKWPRRGRCLVVVINATTLMATDATMHDQGDTGLLAQLGPVATLSQ